MLPPTAGAKEDKPLLILYTWARGNFNITMVGYGPEPLLHKNYISEAHLREIRIQKLGDTVTLTCHLHHDLIACHIFFCKNMHLPSA